MSNELLNPDDLRIDLYNLDPVGDLEENVWISGNNMNKGEQIRCAFMHTQLEEMDKFGSTTGEKEQRTVAYFLQQMKDTGIVKQRKATATALVNMVSGLPPKTPIQITFLGSRLGKNNMSYHDWKIELLGNVEKQRPVSEEFEPFV